MAGVGDGRPGVRRDAQHAHAVENPRSRRESKRPRRARRVGEVNVVGGGAEERRVGKAWRCREAEALEYDVQSSWRRGSVEVHGGLAAEQTTGGPALAGG